MPPLTGWWARSQWEWVCFYCNFPGPLADCHRLTQTHGQLRMTEAPITGPSRSCRKTTGVVFLTLRTSYQDTPLSANNIPSRSFGKVGEDRLGSGAQHESSQTQWGHSASPCLCPSSVCPGLQMQDAKERSFPTLTRSVYFCSCLGSREGCWFHEIPIF